jgi:SSS family solute:Na+ symporter
MLIYIILFGYLGLALLLSRLNIQKTIEDSAQYYLTNRSLKGITLFFTLVATNFSAFFFIGFAGEAYRVGYSYYSMMAFGTSFAAVSFFLIGSPAWRLSKTKGYITPSEMLGDVMGSQTLTRLTAILMIVFMVPFVGIQIIGAGLIVSGLTQGAIPYFWGSTLLIGFILIYIWRSGMYSVARLDVANGLILMTLIILAFVFVSRSLGGLPDVHKQLMASNPELFTPQGVDNKYSPSLWLSFMVLWLTCLPMFPQIFLRFLMAKKEKDFRYTSFLYTIVPPLLFIFPVALGIMGHLSFPGLEGKAADQIIPRLLTTHLPGGLGALILTGALAAFVSTTDSTLLALSSLIARDLYKPIVKPDLSEKDTLLVGRISILVLCLISLVIAFFQPASIFQIAALTFSGLSSIFPVFLAALRFNYRRPVSAIVAMILGEVTLVLFTTTLGGYAGLWNILPVVPAVAVTTLVLVVGRFIEKNRP